MHTPLFFIVAISTLVGLASVSAELDPEEKEALEWTPPEDFKTKYPYYLSGYDKEGSPVYVVEVGKWDLRDAIERGPEVTEELDKMWTQMFLRGRTHGSEAPGSPGCVVIVDGEGFNLRQASHPDVVRFLLRQVPKLERILRKPGVKKIICVNYNYLIKRVYDLAMPLLGASANIFEVYGTNADRWKPALLKQIDADQLPEWYGGTKGHKPLKVFP